MPLNEKSQPRSFTTTAAIQRVPHEEVIKRLKRNRPVIDGDSKFSNLVLF